MNLRVVAFCLIAACGVSASAADLASRFVQKVALPPQQIAVVAEGDFEARSIGSYSVRVYSTEGGQPGNDTTFYAAGIVRPRDGAVESLSLAKLDLKGPPVLVVTIRSAGSGGYLSADAFLITKGEIRLIGSVSGLPPNADPVPALREAVQRGKAKRPPGG